MTILGKLSASEIKIRALKLLEVRSPHRAACASVHSARLQDVGLRDRVAHLPSELSGGEQQRTTIARGQHASVGGMERLVGWGGARCAGSGQEALELRCAG